MDESGAGGIRIGELARRTGVGAPLLRAWERRYGLLRPERTAGGLRAYGPDDERRVWEMRERRAEGMSASLAAAAVLAAERSGGAERAPLSAILAELESGLARFDEQMAQEALDRLFGAYGLGTALTEGVLPYLSGLGERWEAGTVTIAEEHFATAIVRGRLLALARNWGAGRGPRALLACPPGEQHDLGLICFGLALRERGWRIMLLGPNTPIATVAEVAARLRPALVVIAAMQEDGLRDARRELVALARDHRVALGGPGAPPDLARSVGARALEGDPVVAARRVDTEMAADGPGPTG